MTVQADKLQKYRAITKKNYIYQYIISLKPEGMMTKRYILLVAIRKKEDISILIHYL